MSIINNPNATFSPLMNLDNNEQHTCTPPNILVEKHSIEQVELPKKPCFLLDNVLSKEECQYLIDSSEKVGYEDADKFCHAYNDRYNDRLLVDDDKLTELIWNRIKSHLPKTIMNQGKKRSLVGLNPRLRLCKYKSGHYFGMHIDGTFLDEPNQTISCLTLLIYLNSQLDNDFEGGSTVFFNSRTKIMTRKVVAQSGSALIFLQQDKDMLHSGEKVYKGVKYILRTDVMYSNNKCDE